jgi:hypothetical protein
VAMATEKHAKEKNYKKTTLLMHINESESEHKHCIFTVL